MLLQCLLAAWRPSTWAGRAGSVETGKPAAFGAGHRRAANRKRKFLGLFVVALAVCSVFLCPGQGAEPPLGLYVNNGELMRGGEPYRGIGVNYFDVFYRALLNGSDTSYEEGFHQLGLRQIPFARFMAGGFWPNDMQLYFSDHDEYFRRFDAVVASAEQHGVGLVPTLFWYFPTVPDIVDEPVNRWGDDTTQTHAFMRQYATELINRYKDSAAIWAWEFVNEYNLAKDLPETNPYYLPPVVPDRGTPEARTEEDATDSTVHRFGVGKFAELVRTLDPDRMITSGNSIPRNTAYHLRTERQFICDTLEQYAEELVNDNPDPTDSLSIHAYFQGSEHRFAEAETDYRKLIALTAAVSDRVGKPLFVGEFGVKEGETAEPEDRLRAMLNAYCEADVDLMALWVYDYGNQPEWSIRWDNDRAWMLDVIGEYNQIIADGGWGKPVPEPATLALLVSVLLGLLLWRQRAA